MRPSSIRSTLNGKVGDTIRSNVPAKRARFKLTENVTSFFRLTSIRALAIAMVLGLALATGCAAAPGPLARPPSVAPVQTPTSVPTVLAPIATAIAQPSASATPVAPSPTAVPATPTAVSSPTLVPTRTQAPDPLAQWATYTSSTYNVTLRYPGAWSKDPRYTLPNQERYVGPDGFFQVAAASAASLDAAANSEANHPLHPYGTHPTITAFRLNGQDARLILPSSDQPAEMAGQAALIVVSPKPITLGSESYPYLVLWADQGHLKEIESTLVVGGTPHE